MLHITLARKVMLNLALNLPVYHFPLSMKSYKLVYKITVIFYIITIIYNCFLCVCIKPCF